MLDELLHHSVALTELEVAAANSRPQNLSFYIFREWLKMSPTKRNTALIQANDVVNVAYLDSDRDINTVSIIINPSVCLNRLEWVID